MYLKIFLDLFSDLFLEFRNRPSFGFGFDSQKRPEFLYFFEKFGQISRYSTELPKSYRNARPSLKAIQTLTQEEFKTNLVFFSEKFIS